MAAGTPVVRAVANGSAPSSSTSVSVTRPGSVVNGDLLIAFQTSDADGSLAAMSAPTGWTELGNIAGTSGAGYSKVWQRVASSEPATWTFGKQTGSTQLVAVVAVSAGTWQTGQTFTEVLRTAASATSQTTSSTTAADNGLLLCFWSGSGGGGGSARTRTPQAGMTELLDVLSSDSWVSMGVASQAVAAGSTGTRSSTITASEPYMAGALVIVGAALIEDPFPNDRVTGTDGVTTAATTARSGADSVGITDAASRVAAAGRSAADPVGITDAATWTRILPTVPVADALTVTDAASAVLVTAGTVLEPVPITDAVAAQQRNIRTSNDPVPVTDTAAATTGRTSRDTVGLTDSVTASVAFHRSPADGVGITDVGGVSGGTAAGPVRSTANILATSPSGVAVTARLKATATVRATTAAKQERGPQRAVIRLAITGDLGHIRALSARADPLVDFPDPSIRIVRALTDVIRDPEPEPMMLPARHLSATPAQTEPEPDPDILPERKPVSGPRRYARTFLELRP